MNKQEQPISESIFCKHNQIEGIAIKNSQNCTHECLLSGFSRVWEQPGVGGLIY
jgi:hypothetical protein